MSIPANILSELQELSPALAAVPRVNVFSVPAAYFDNLAGDVLLKIYNAEAEITKSQLSPSVPEGYFENLAGNILAKIKSSALVDDVSEETSFISPVVAGISNANVFSVPGNYFEQLPATVMSRLGSSENVQEELENISPLLAGISNANIYRVPAGYFEQLNIAPYQEKPAAKVVSMKPRTNIFRYAAAAVVMGILAVSSYFILNNKNNAGYSSAVMAEAKQIIKTDSYDEKLSTVSDEAIVQFLESKGQDVEAALVASLTDEKSLPSTTDYLIDDNTLDEVLKTIDLNN